MQWVMHEFREPTSRSFEQLALQVSWGPRQRAVILAVDEQPAKRITRSPREINIVRVMLGLVGRSRE